MTFSSSFARDDECGPTHKIIDNAAREVPRGTFGRELARQLRVPLLCFMVAAFAFDGRRAPVLCPYRMLSGRSCPLCGTTRAVGRLLHGDVRGARKLHAVSSALFLPAALSVLVVGSRSIE
jgi:hypothetical protein